MYKSNFCNSNVGRESHKIKFVNITNIFVRKRFCTIRASKFIAEKEVFMCCYIKFLILENSCFLLICN